MADVFFGVRTQSNKYLAIPARWIENSNSKMSKIFYSHNVNDESDFDQDTKYFFDSEKAACYNAHIIRELGKCDHWWKNMN